MQTWANTKKQCECKLQPSVMSTVEMAERRVAAQSAEKKAIPSRLNPFGHLFAFPEDLAKWGSGFLRGEAR